MVQRVSLAERRRRQRTGDRGFVYLRATLRLPRLGEVAISEAPGPPPSYTLRGGVRLYGLGPPRRAAPLSPTEIAARLTLLLPEGLEIRVAREWRGVELHFRIVHPPTGVHVIGTVRLAPDDYDGMRGISSALGKALWQLRVAVDEATPPA